MAQALQEKFAAGRSAPRSERSPAASLRLSGRMEKEMADLIQRDIGVFGCQVDGLERYRVTRQTAQRLVADEADIAPEQAKRIASKEFADRLVPLARLYPLTSADQDEIRDQAREWEKRFDDEIKRRGPGGPERSRGSLRNDAVSLALVLWIVQTGTAPRETVSGKPASDVKHPDERIVFVTGDSVMFHAYRRWYAEQTATRPFVLRRLTQYSPIINLDDASSDVSGHRELFERTRIAIESALFLFNLGSRERTPLEERQLASGRDDLAVRLTDFVRLLELPEDQWKPGSPDEKVFGFFAPLLREWLPENAPRLKELGSLWQSLERFAIGVSHDLVVRREAGAAPAQAAIAARDSGLTDVYLAYIASSLTTLAVDSLRMMFPFVAQYLLDATAEKEFEDGAELRVPITIRLLVPAGEAGSREVPYEAQDLLRQIRDKEPEIISILDVKQNGRLAERPHLVYALAAALALRVGHWPEAERFADLATPDDPTSLDVFSRVAEGDQTLADEDEKFEFLYLAAVAKRFRMGSRAPLYWGAREDIWLRSLNSAVDMLTRCERHHASRGELFRETRAVSERAAARLFYASWAAITPPDILERCNFDFATAIHEFHLGLDDLRKCRGLEMAARARSRLEPVRISFFERIERQYTINLAAGQVLRHLLSRPGHPVDGLLPEECDELTLRLAPMMEAGASLPSVAMTDVDAFLALERKNQAASARLLRGSELRARLPLDRDTLEAVRHHLRPASQTQA
jgi:hypothetical protein